MFRERASVRYGRGSGFAGERHFPMYIPGVGIAKGNFAGPGTKIIRRLKRGDKPRNYVDSLAKTHDASYALAQHAPTLKDQKKLVRKADEAFLKGLRKSKGNFVNKTLARAAMSSKIGLEDAKLIPEASFSGEMKQYKPREVSLLKQAVREGSGKKRAVKLSQLLPPEWNIPRKKVERALAMDGNKVKNIARSVLSHLLKGQKVDSKHIPKLGRELEQGLRNAIKHSSKTSGKRLGRGSFFKSFKKTLKQIMKPVSTAVMIASPVLGPEALPAGAVLRKLADEL